MLNLTFSTQTDMLDSTFSTLFHIWVLSVENVEFYQGQFEGFFTIF